MSVRHSNTTLVLVTLALLVALALSGCAPVAQATPRSAGDSPSRTITVVGRGQVKASPDIATINLGVEVVASTIDEAMPRAKDQMAAILDALQKIGIAAKDVQTSNFSIGFERNTSTGSVKEAPATLDSQGQLSGVYHVSNMVQVTIRNLDQVGTALDAAVKAGANNVWGINFGLEDTATLEGQARAKAIDDAKARAQDLARLNGVTVGNVVAISEVISGGSVPVFSAVAMAKAYGGGGGAPIEPGELTFDTQVQVVYAIQ